MSTCRNRGGLEGIAREITCESQVRVVFGAGGLDRLGAIVRDERAPRVLLVTDPRIVATGHVERGLRSLQEAGLQVAVFDGVEENPTTEHVAAGVQVARAFGIDLLVGLGGGSSMDCAKGINLIHTNGGQIADYRGVNKPTHPMLPMVLVPTTAGTGSEAQSFALIADPASGQKMACGDRRPPSEGGLRPRVAILDPELTRSQPPKVAAAAGMDAIGHAVETAATTERSDVSRRHSRRAWELLEAAYVTAVCNPEDDYARERMLLGAHLAGVAIEGSMLGAAHATANPLTARCGLAHGVAVGVMLPHVVRFNSVGGANPYSDLCDAGERLADRLESFLETAGLPVRLGQCGVPREVLPELAVLAAEQWTAKFNPTPVSEAELLLLYHNAYE